MKLIGLKLATVSALSILAFSYNSSHAGSAGMELQSTKKKFKMGAVNPAVQNVVNQFQAWALEKTKNPNYHNDMIAIPVANTNKRILGNNTQLTQEIMEKAASLAAKDIGYEVPMNRIMNATIKMRIGDFMKASDAFVLKYIAKNNAEKNKVWIDARNSLNEKAARRDLVQAKVLGPESMVNICEDRHSLQYDKTVSCEVLRMKVTVMLFADIIDKLQSSGVLDENDLAELKEATTVDYYFVQQPEKKGQWSFEEVTPGFGIGWMLAKTSF